MDNVIELEAMKASLIREILTEVNSKDLLERLKQYLRENLKGVVPPCQYSIEEAKQLLKEAELRYERGEYLSDEEAMKRMEQWL